MKKLNTLYAVLTLTVGLWGSARAGIVGSAHDFTVEAWNVNKDVCGPCHMVHGSDPNNQLIPLWSHETVQEAWQPYVSPHGTAIGDPDGASLACLSCHDGTLAYNQLKGQTVGTEHRVLGSYRIGAGGDLRGDHPISFVYNDAVNNPNNPSNTLWLATSLLGTAPNNALPVDSALNGKSLSSAFLKEGKLQCNTCHDVHRSIGDSGINSAWLSGPVGGASHNPLLVVVNSSSRLGADGYGSSLCRSCHNK